jgi:hypothetical protein
VAGPNRSARISFFWFQELAMRKPLFQHTHIIKLGRMLDMQYRPSEIADEIGVCTDTICRSYLPAGLPCTRDEKGNVWIHGLTFAAWAKETIAKKASKRTGLAADQGWCLRCGCPVQMIAPTVRDNNYYTELLQSRCPNCGTPVNRLRARSASAPEKQL